MPEEVKKNKLVRKALAKAKELEAEPIPSQEELVELYKKNIEEAERLRKLLKPSWFIRDVHVEKRARKKRKKKKSL